MAAANDVEIGLRHVAAATRSEFAKLGMQAVEIDIAERGLAA